MAFNSFQVFIVSNNKNSFKSSGYMIGSYSSLSQNILELRWFHRPLVLTASFVVPRGAFCACHVLVVARVIFFRLA